ncbi:MAG: hypothetical protein IPL08_03205 [Saprospiraceae bacterium]|nr:hypothetical protein [Saprospiraceae bacterium]MBK8667963.1 hypothetical protein [Saprospiraceae bacterium]MBL0100454.1 hypothetical protein [Saprospiraceae bacterium]
MNLNKWANIIKVILLKVVDELEKRINERNGVDTTDHFSSSLYTSLKFIVLEQVDGLVDEAVSYTKHQVNDLSSLIAQKTSVILASLVYVLILLGMVFLSFIFFALALSLFIGHQLGNNYLGFLITGGIILIICIIVYVWGPTSIARGIKNRIISML